MHGPPACTWCTQPEMSSQDTGHGKGNQRKRGHKHRNHGNQATQARFMPTPQASMNTMYPETTAPMNTMYPNFQAPINNMYSAQPIAPMFQPSEPYPNPMCTVAPSISYPC